jgi:hypothetical protein
MIKLAKLEYYLQLKKTDAKLTNRRKLLLYYYFLKKQAIEKKSKGAELG